MKISQDEMNMMIDLLGLQMNELKENVNMFHSRYIATRKAVKEIEKNPDKFALELKDFMETSEELMEVFADLHHKLHTPSNKEETQDTPVNWDDVSPEKIKKLYEDVMNVNLTSECDGEVINTPEQRMLNKLFGVRFNAECN